MNGNGSFRRSCTAFFTNGHIIIACLSLVSIAGTAAGVYATLNASISENRRAIDDLRRYIDSTEAMDRLWKEEEHRYDQEVRSTMHELDLASRAADSQLSERLIQLNARVNGLFIDKKIPGSP